MANSIYIPGESGEEKGMPKLLIFLIAFWVFSLVVFLVVWVNRDQSKKEVDAFQVKPWTVKKCPLPFGLVVRNESFGPGETHKAAHEINQELRSVLGRNAYVLKGDQGGNAVITVSQGVDGDCVMPNVGPEPPMGGVTMGFLHFKVSNQDSTLQSSAIVMCADKFKRLARIAKKPRWLKVRRGEWGKYIKHELLHPLLGAGHIQWSAGVFHPNAPRRRISKEVKAILSRVYRGCKQKGR